MRNQRVMKDWHAFVLGAAIIAAIFMLRIISGRPPFALGESYAQMLLAEQSSPLTAFEGIAPSLATPLAALPEIVMVALLVLLAGTAAVLLTRIGYRLLPRHGWLVPTIAFVMPSTHRIFSTFSGDAFALVCLLAAAVLIGRRSAAVLIGIAWLFSAPLGLLGTAAAVVLLLPRSRIGEGGWILGGAVAGVLIRTLIAPIPWPLLLAKEWSITDALFTFGNPGGLPLTLILLGLFGLAWGWRREWHLLAQNLGAIALLALAPLCPAARVLVGLVLSIFTAQTIAWSAQRRWALSEARALALLLMACALVFTFVASVSTSINEPPGPEDVAAMAMLTRAQADGVLTHPSYAPYLAVASGKRPWVLTERPRDDRHAQMEMIWHSGDFEVTRGLLAHNEIDFIVITPRMRDGLVWDERDAELPFLLERSERFARVNDGAIELWVVVREYPE